MSQDESARGHAGVLLRPTGVTLKFRYLNQQGEMIGCYFALGENTFVEVFDHADAHRRSQSSQPIEPLEEPRDS